MSVMHTIVTRDRLREVFVRLWGATDLDTGTARIDSPTTLLFFAGGSRSNPGPGDAWAVLVRLDTAGGAAVVTWAACRSLAARSTTNNVAEYHGLCVGLEEARPSPQPLVTLDARLVRPRAAQSSIFSLSLIAEEEAQLDRKRNQILYEIANSHAREHTAARPRAGRSPDR
ncbi:hypothetical protein PybrP1_001521 [[Pythium] brassicae (nom. inval.)]|nr:hypothetical protein PybrP1_001521 [[Pythium] brassicae (nom. inval.)]